MNEQNSNTDVIQLTGAGERAKAWLLNLLTDLYQQYGEQLWESPLMDQLTGLLQLPLPMLGPIRNAVSTFRESGPAALGDKLRISDEEAVTLLNLFYGSVVDGFKAVLNVDLEAEA